MNRDEIIEHMANAMMKYDSSAGEKTWRELATVAYHAYINSIYYESLAKIPPVVRK